MSEKAAIILENLVKAGRSRGSVTASTELAAHVIEAIRAKKAKDIVLLDMRDVSEIADYFVICTGESDVQIKAIVDGVESHVKEEINERPWRTEGFDTRQWVLIDYVDVVVHVFDPQRRDYYNLERLWADAPIERLEDDDAVASSGRGKTT